MYNVGFSVLSLNVNGLEKCIACNGIIDSFHIPMNWWYSCVELQFSCNLFTYDGKIGLCHIALKAYISQPGVSFNSLCQLEQYYGRILYNRYSTYAPVSYLGVWCAIFVQRKWSFHIRVKVDFLADVRFPPRFVFVGISITLSFKFHP